MDILLNPNVAYIVLVSAFLMAFVALLVPGTGLLELGALFLLLAAAYLAYQLPINFWALFILLVGIVPFVLSLRRKSSPLYLPISIIALIIGSAFMFRGSSWLPAVNPLLALVVSVSSAFFLWVVSRKSLEASMAPPSHDLGHLIGESGEAVTDIHEEGSVQMRSELWSARSEQPIPAGSAVRVIGRDGLILLVEKA